MIKTQQQYEQAALALDFSKEHRQVDVYESGDKSHALQKLFRIQF